MSSSENVEQVAVALTAPAASNVGAIKKAGAVKKPAAKKSGGVKKAGFAGGDKVPTTSALVTAAIQELKERRGSSAAAIKKFVAQKSGRELTAAFNTTINKNLAKMMKAGQLISGAPAGRKGAGCFKLAPEEKQRLASNARAQVKKAAALAAGKVLKKYAGVKKAGTKKKAGIKVAKKAGQKVVKKAGGSAGKKGAKAGARMGATAKKGVAAKKSVATKKGVAAKKGAGIKNPAGVKKSVGAKGKGAKMGAA